MAIEKLTVALERLSVSILKLTAAFESLSVAIEKLTRASDSPWLAIEKLTGVSDSPLLATEKLSDSSRSLLNAIDEARDRSTSLPSTIDKLTDASDPHSIELDKRMGMSESLSIARDGLTIARTPPSIPVGRRLTRVIGLWSNWSLKALAWVAATPDPVSSPNRRLPIAFVFWRVGLQLGGPSTWSPNLPLHDAVATVRRGQGIRRSTVRWPQVSYMAVASVQLGVQFAVLSHASPNCDWTRPSPQ